MKRFTETNKWRDRWYRRLSQTSKLLWIWLTDNCDNAGVIDIDLESATFDIGKSVNLNHLTEVESRLKKLPNGKFWIVKFVEFQYGKTLSDACTPHKRIIELLRSHNIRYPEDADESSRVVGRVETTHKNGTGQEEDKEQDKKGVQGDKYHADSRAVLHALNEASGRHFRETDENLTFISGRLSEDGVTIDGVRRMILRQCSMWKSDPKMCEYLRPETLFNATKFDAYYSAKDLPTKFTQSSTAPNI